MLSKNIQPLWTNRREIFSFKSIWFKLSVSKIHNFVFQNLGYSLNVEEECCYLLLSPVIWFGGQKEQLLHLLSALSCSISLTCYNRSLPEKATWNLFWLSVKIQATIEGKSWQQKCETYGHIAYAIRRLSEKHAVLSSFSPFNSVQDSAPWNGAPTVMVVFSTQLF